MDDRITRLRQLLREHIPEAPAPAANEPLGAEQQRLRAFEYYEFNVGLPAVEQTHRARALREIARIATWYNWGAEDTRALDREGVAVVGEMGDDGVEFLLERMQGLESSAQAGCDAPDSLPAR